MALMTHARMDGQGKQRDEIPRKNQKEMLQIKYTITEMKNAFDGFIS